VTTWAGLQNSPELQASELVKYRDSATGMWTYINEAVGCEWREKTVLKSVR
jgi:hypothetical protein